MITMKDMKKHKPMTRIDLRTAISETLVKWQMSTRQVAILDILSLVDEYVGGVIGEDEEANGIEDMRLTVREAKNWLRNEQRERAFGKGRAGICRHCQGPITARNPEGFCDHLYYPENCEVCGKEHR